ncbi:MAG: hypothetical protein ACO3RV_06225 [Luteolibacter sp.]
MKSQLASPEKELRFTRSGQAVVFCLLAASFASAAMVLLVVSFYRPENPELPSALWALPPALLAVLSVRLAVHLTRHAYLILTPLGVEIFPFFKPAQGMQLISWHEIAEVEADPAMRLLTLHHNPEKSAGIHLSLRPLRPSLRPLLVHAIAARVKQRAAQAAPSSDMPK